MVNDRVVEEILNDFVSLKLLYNKINYVFVFVFLLIFVCYVVERYDWLMVVNFFLRILLDFLWNKLYDFYVVMIYFIKVVVYFWFG